MNPKVLGGIMKSGYLQKTMANECDLWVGN